MARLTAPHRERRAQAFEREALRREHFGVGTSEGTGALGHLGHADGVTERSARANGTWHRARAKGQRERPANVRGCGEETAVRLSCDDCGKVDERAGRCGSTLLCLSCRGRRARRERCRFEAARRATLADARKRGLLQVARRGGRYGERFITLTVPHLGTDTIRSRIERVFRAWPRFLKLLNAWVRSKGAPIEFVRVFEWTPGDDNLGHPHIHAWVFSPYIDQEDLTDWWARALEHTGIPSGYPILKVHVTEVPGARLADELIKYLCKDIGAGGRYIAPETYAEVYAALDGRRVLQSSRGFHGRAGAHIGCPHCGCLRSRRARVVRETALSIRADPVALGDAPPTEGSGPDSGSARVPARPR